MRSTKVSQVVFVSRSPPAGGQPELGAARAWRIVARPAADFAADQAAVAAGQVPVAPAGCLDGVYPVWVRLTDPETGGDVPELLLVDGDGWSSAPTGRDWRIEYVGARAAAATDRFAFVVETVQDLDEAGQVNTHAGQVARRERAADVVIPAGYVIDGTYTYRGVGFARLAAQYKNPPPWARRLEIWYRNAAIGSGGANVISFAGFLTDLRSGALAANLGTGTALAYFQNGAPAQRHAVSLGTGGTSNAAATPFYDTSPAAPGEFGVEVTLQSNGAVVLTGGDLTIIGVYSE